ncbi:MAG TPA: hypothetical protein VFS21_33235 [Roseiflexaceae bacterium]|nr:hypothetical protein [Roseiflexaceae bacterium]
MSVTIRRNRKTKDFDLYAGKEYIGSAETISEALTRKAEAEARLSGVAQLTRQ